MSSLYWNSPLCFFVNILRLRQHGHHFAGNILKCIFLHENVWISIKISLKFVPRCPINNISTSVQIMAWHRPGNKPLSEPMMVSLLTHMCHLDPWELKKRFVWLAVFDATNRNVICVVLRLNLFQCKILYGYGQIIIFADCWEIRIWSPVHYVDYMFM